MQCLATLLFTFYFLAVNSKPLFLTKTITDFASSASASASSFSQDGNIADLRRSEKVSSFNISDTDPFFRDASEAPPVSSTAPPPSILQTKLNKIVRKIRFFTMLVNGGMDSGNDDDFQKEQDDFDREFEQDQKLVIFTGYQYPKGGKAEQQQVDKLSLDTEGVNAGSIGVFFMELLGSVIGLAYGAAAQLTASTTAAPA